MKGKLIGKLLENRKIVRAGCGLMAAAVLLSGGLYVYDSQNTAWELPVVIEGGDAFIEDEAVPLAQAPTVKKTKKIKTTTKKVKLKKANKKTYTKKLKTKKKTKTTTQKKTDRTIKTVVKTTTATTEKYKKKQKFKTVVTKVTTETTVTTTMKATKAATTTPATTKPAAAATPAAGTSETVVKKTLDASTVLPKADANVRNAFIQLGFTIKVDSTVGYMGKFSATTKSITMRKEDHESIYHELGHFLMFMYLSNKDNDGGTKGKAAYAAEKALYTGFNNAYVNQDASEYMAESYRDYCTDPAKLQAERPKTYALIQEAVASVDDAKVAKYKMIYGW